MSDLPSITILSGAPGTGKTTIAKALGQRWSNEDLNPLHMLTDLFFSFPVTVIPPETPEAQQQNEVMSRAVAASAKAFASGGYKVILDGVIGPWMLPHYLGSLSDSPGRIAYVILRAPLEETLRRATTRFDAEKFSEEGVRHMHRQFADLKAFEAHVFETRGKSADETENEIAAALAKGEFRISIS